MTYRWSDRGLRSAHNEHKFDATCAICTANVEAVAGAVITLGWRPPPRRIETAAAIAEERTGTVIRSRSGDIGSVDHGPNGEWIGPATLVHLLDPGSGIELSVADLADDELASTFPYTVLHEPEEAGR
jgi:hypothetical protein